MLIPTALIDDLRHLDLELERLLRLAEKVELVSGEIHVTPNDD